MSAVYSSVQKTDPPLHITPALPPLETGRLTAVDYPTPPFVRRVLQALLDQAQAITSSKDPGYHRTRLEFALARKFFRHTWLDIQQNSPNAAEALTRFEESALNPSSYFRSFSALYRTRQSLMEEVWNALHRIYRRPGLLPPEATFDPIKDECNVLHSAPPSQWITEAFEKIAARVTAAGDGGMAIAQAMRVCYTIANFSEFVARESGVLGKGDAAAIKVWETSLARHYQRHLIDFQREGNVSPRFSRFAIEEFFFKTLGEMGAIQFDPTRSSIARIGEAPPTPIFLAWASNPGTSSDGSPLSEHVAGSRTAIVGRFMAFIAKERNIDWSNVTDTNTERGAKLDRIDRELVTQAEDLLVNFLDSTYGDPNFAYIRSVLCESFFPSLNHGSRSLDMRRIALRPVYGAKVPPEIAEFCDEIFKEVRRSESGKGGISYAGAKHICRAIEAFVEHVWFSKGKHEAEQLLRGNSHDGDTAAVTAMRKLLWARSREVDRYLEALSREHPGAYTYAERAIRGRLYTWASQEPHAYCQFEVVRDFPEIPSDLPPATQLKVLRKKLIDMTNRYEEGDREHEALPRTTAVQIFDMAMRAARFIVEKRGLELSAGVKNPSSDEAADKLAHILRNEADWILREFPATYTNLNGEANPSWAQSILLRVFEILGPQHIDLNVARWRYQPEISAPVPECVRDFFDSLYERFGAPRRAKSEHIFGGQIRACAVSYIEFLWKQLGAQAEEEIERKSDRTPQWKEKVALMESLLTDNPRHSVTLFITRGDQSRHSRSAAHERNLLYNYFYADPALEQKLKGFDPAREYFRPELSCPEPGFFASFCSKLFDDVHAAAPKKRYARLKSAQKWMRDTAAMIETAWEESEGNTKLRRLLGGREISITNPIAARAADGLLRSFIFDPDGSFFMSHLQKRRNEALRSGDLPAFHQYTASVRAIFSHARQEGLSDFQVPAKLNFSKERAEPARQQGGAPRAHVKAPSNNTAKPPREKGRQALAGRVAPPVKEAHLPRKANPIASVRPDVARVRQPQPIQAKAATKKDVSPPPRPSNSVSPQAIESPQVKGAKAPVEILSLPEGIIPAEKVTVPLWKVEESRDTFLSLLVCRRYFSFHDAIRIRMHEIAPHSFSLTTRDGATVKIPSGDQDTRRAFEVYLHNYRNSDFKMHLETLRGSARLFVREQGSTFCADDAPPRGMSEQNQKVFRKWRNIFINWLMQEAGLSIAQVRMLDSAWLSADKGTIKLPEDWKQFAAPTDGTLITDRRLALKSRAWPPYLEVIRSSYPHRDAWDPMHRGTPMAVLIQAINRGPLCGDEHIE